MHGEKIIEKKVNQKDALAISINNIPAGSYFAKVTTPTTYMIEKFIIIR